MADKTDQPGLKSRGSRPVLQKPGTKELAAKPGLKSRGMFSHGGAPAADGTPKPKKSRGMLTHGTEVNSGQAKTLDTPKPRRPYSLGEE
ncbi:hypothetical protein [Roseibium litorale]|uniref:Uncharacterized protein n=1 Tax=Roseibium litorale TaxID=2803841 RepID=A0ABR9CP64_9HYPH|nr:hypothetical protein [Roseibium litorale]MBD8892409.1 hypothetical protein [Roseibium litorale]